MTTHVVNTHEAESRLSELIREAEEGAEVIVARNGRPVASFSFELPAAATVAACALTFGDGGNGAGSTFERL